MTRATCEVAVVGAGPAGSRAARRLAEAGRDVVLADENPGPREDVVCTGIVGEEAWRRVDLPTDAVVDTVPAAQFVSPGGREVGYEPDEPLARVVDRTRFDGALGRRARRAGARLRRGWAARSVEKDASGVTIGFETADGPVRLRARALVVATGHQRWLHDAAGLGTPDRYVHGVHADLPFRGARAAELFFGNDVAPGFFAWAVPFGEETARLGVLAPQGSRRRFFRLLRHPAVAARVEAPEADGSPSAVPWLHSRAIVQGPVTPSVADRVLAVGEAAGQVKTTTAGGIYYGLQGADLAADVLHGALDGARGPTAAALGAYEDAWRARLGGEIRAGLRLQEAVRGMDDGDIDRLFGHLQGALGSAVKQVVEFDWHRPALEVLFAHRWIGRLLGAEPALASRAG